MQKITDSAGNTLQMLGRAGILFTTKDSEFFIDSEGLAGPEFGIAIFKKDVYKIVNSKREPINEIEQKDIIEKVVDLLHTNKIYVEVI